MPTTKKILTFLGSFFTSLGSFAVICSVLGTKEWVHSTVDLTDHSSNITISMSYGLFSGESSRKFDSSLEEPKKVFKVLEELNGSQKTLHSLVILFLVLSLLASLLSAGFSLYNSISNPYQTFLGSVGVHTWSGLSMSLIFLTMILFVANTQSNDLSKMLAQSVYSVPPDATYHNTVYSYRLSFWLLLLALVLGLGTVGIVLFYQKARYQRKQEQRKPMEEAPRDGILF